MSDKLLKVVYLSHSLLFVIFMSIFKFLFIVVPIYYQYICIWVHISLYPGQHKYCLLYLGQNDRQKWIIIVLIDISLMQEVLTIFTFLFPMLKTVSVSFAYFSECLKTEIGSYIFHFLKPQLSEVRRVSLQGFERINIIILLSFSLILLSSAPLLHVVFMKPPVVYIIF